MPSSGPLRVIIFTMVDPKLVARLAAKICAEVPGAMVCGVLYELPRRKSFRERVLSFLTNLRDWTFMRYVCARILRAMGRPLVKLGSLLLKVIHAGPGNPNHEESFGIEELNSLCRKLGGSLHVTQNMHSAQALQFVRSLKPDLAVVYGTRILKPELFEIPTQGSINIHKRKVPDYRGGGAIGLWELLDDQSEIGITVHRVAVKLDAGSVVRATTIPIDPFDDLESLALKASVVGDDLIVQSVADFARGSVQETPQTGMGRMFRTPKPSQLASLKKQISGKRPRFHAARSRPLWKLVVRCLLFLPLVTIRNWIRRFRGRFPVVILFHHLVTDRLHPMGIPTFVLARQLEFLKKYYRIVSLSQALEMLQKGRVEAPTVVLTLDDGYRENFLNLRAVAEHADVRATLFICTQNVTTQREFDHDLRQNLQGFLPLTWEQVEYLSRRGYEMGSHTRSHFNCGATDHATLKGEIVGSKLDLEQHSGREVAYFSFPWGHPENMSQPAIELARSTYRYIFSAFGGENFPSPDGESWHLKRRGHPNSLLELELALQSILNLGY